MMSGLEINATFVSCKKTSMYLTSMSREELYAEAHKDLIAISTKANMFIDKVRKKATMMSPFPMAPQRMTITTTRRNVWTIEGRYNSYMHALAFQAYAPVIATSSNGYIQITKVCSITLCIIIRMSCILAGTMAVISLFPTMASL